MCTITVLRAGELLRVACNRDELRQRPAAHPPFIARAGSQQVLMPQDPRGRGTWIAANSAGLVFALLNVHMPGARGGTLSRGLIIPELFDCASLDDFATRVDGIPADLFAPFRLLVADRDDLVDVTPSDGRCDLDVHRVRHPLLFTSSSLGDALVEGPRRALFEQMLATPWDLAAQQDAYHAHRWRDRPAVSVHMSRPDACTVSTTVVEVSAREVRMVYQPAHCDAGTAVGLVIDRQDVRDDASRRARREHAAV